MPINLRACIVDLKNYFVQLNLFYTDTQDEQTIQNERRSTRLYLILFINSMIISTLSYIIIPHTETIIKKSPSFIEYSILMHQSSLQCLCSKISIKYEEFIQIEPFYHRICQSDFISDQWINYLHSLYEESWNNSISSDFRRIGIFQFRTIRSLCQLVTEMNENSVQIFLQKELIQSQLILQEQFHVQINSFIIEFINSTSKLFSRTLYFVQNTTAQSLLMTGASLTNILPNDQSDYYFYGLSIPFIGMVYQLSNGSTCTCSSSTATTCMVTATFENNSINGFQTGCYMMNALFKSTLEILYNQSFLNKLTNYSIHVQKLDSSTSNATIEMLLNRMFVDHWLNKTSYEQYFNACAPDFCQYTIIQRNDFLETITFMLGLFGGLSSALRIIASFIIFKICSAISKFISRRRLRVNQVVTTRGFNVGVYLKALFRLIKRKLIELNLFNTIPSSRDVNVIQQQRYTTRVYLLLLFTGLSILILFNSLRIQTIYVTIENPTSIKFIDLYDQYRLTLNCPCNQTTMKYNQFIFDLKPQYHEICSSECVSSNWINLKFIKFISTEIHTDDIRSQLQTYFQLLSTLCHGSNQIVEDNLELFYQTNFISPSVLSFNSFQIQINAIIEQFQRTIPELFENTLELIKANMEINQFVIPINSYFSEPNDNGGILQLHSHFYSERLSCLKNPHAPNCACFTLSIEECYRRIKIVDKKINYIIPGMIYSWFPLQSLLMSTLECLYNNSCLFEIKRFINTNVSSTNFSTLNLSSAYKINDEIEILANKLFIQSWNNKSSFHLYFNQCHPLTCKYSYENRIFSIDIITIIIGLIGGFTIVARLLAPLIVKLGFKIWNSTSYQRRNNIVSSTIRSSFKNRFSSFIKFTSQKMIDLNLFNSTPPSYDIKIIRRNSYATRIYLILLMISLIIILIYTSLKRDTATIVINSPSLSEYKQLHIQYPLTLKCPCTHIAIKYRDLISQFKLEYHQICRSRFLSSEWIDSLYLQYDFPDYKNNFLAAARLQFQTLLKFCILSEKTANLSLSKFYQNDFVTASVISPNDFILQTEALVEQLKKTTFDQFMRVFKLIQATNHGNQLATAFESNWRFILKYSSGRFNELTNMPTLTKIITYGTDNCSCAFQSNCSEFVALRHRASNQSLKQIFGGFRVGCLPLDALIQSSLSCLYNQSCLDMLQAAIYYSKPVPVDLLTYSSAIELNTTIETILSQLFISKWNYQFSFDRYFNECNPHLCQYSYPTKYNRVYIITTLTALFGGLTKALHLIISCTIFLVFKLYDFIQKKKRNIVVPHSEQSNIDRIDNDQNQLEEVSMPTIITNQSAMNSTDQQSEFRIKRIEKVYLVGLIVLAIFVIVIASVIWFISGGNKVNTIVLSSISSTSTTSKVEIKSTTISPHMCHMTLKHQVQTYRVRHDPKSLVIGDFNKDLILDLAVANYGDDTFSILLGNENGTFQTQRNFSTGTNTGPWGIATAYFNGDTLLDLAISLSTSNEVVIFYGISTDALFIRSPNTLYNNISSKTVLGPIETADLNDDGLIDLVVSNQADFTLKDIGPILIFFNTGDNQQFELDYTFASSGARILIGIGDFDNEGRQNDIVVTNKFQDLNIFKSLYWINGSWDNYGVYDLLEDASSLTKGKFNDDEFEDLALVFPKIDVLIILLAYGDETFTQEIYSTATYPTSITRINFNNDQIDDLAVLSCNRTVTIFLGTSTGFFNRNYLSFKPKERNDTQCAHSLKVSDLNRDGKDDLVFIDAETHSIGVLLGTHCFEEI